MVIDAYIATARAASTSSTTVMHVEAGVRSDSDTEEDAKE